MSEMALRALELGDVSGFGSLMLSHMHLIRREHDEAGERVGIGQAVAGNRVFRRNTDLFGL